MSLKKALVFAFICLQVFSQPEEIEVFVVPHAHMDPGWLWTVDEYYQLGVKRILDNILKLFEDQRYTFTHGDIYYFKMWYEMQDEVTKQKVKLYIKQGRLDLVHGGMVSSDEACVNYAAIIQNMQIGRKFLFEEFGVVPTIGFQLDSYGHTETNADLFSQIGLDTIVFSRWSTEQLKQRQENKEMQFNWETGYGTEIFAHYTFRGKYEAPFLFDVWWEGLNGRHQTTQMYLKNNDQLFEDLKKYILEYSNTFQTPQVLLMWGTDFSHIFASETFSLLDILMKKLQNSPKPFKKVNLRYATISQYLNQVHKSQNISWPSTNSMQFEVYNRVENYFWSGFFTSDPYFKKQVSEFENQVFVHDQLHSLTRFDRNASDFNSQAHLTAALMQHHDAITGTHKNVVGKDYIRIMENSKEKMKKSMAQTLKELSWNMHGFKLNLENQNSQSSKSQEELFIAYNPTLSSIKYLTIQSNTSNITLQKLVNGVFQQVHAEAMPKQKSFEILFATELEPLQMAIYKTKPDTNSIEIVSLKSCRELIESNKTDLGDNCNSLLNQSIQSDKVRLTVKNSQPGSNSVMIQLEDFSTGAQHNFEIDLALSPSDIFQEESEQTSSNQGRTGEPKEAADHYEFLGQLPQQLMMQIVDYKIYSGQAFQQIVFQFFDPIAKAQCCNEISCSGDFTGEIALKLMPNATYVNLQIKMPVMCSKSFSKEIFLRLRSDLESDGYFYSDENGLKMKKHKFSTNNLGQNLFPVTQTIAIQSRDTVFSVTNNDRWCQAGTSPQPGHIYLLVNRILQHYQGLPEPLQENGILNLNYNLEFQNKIELHTINQPLIAHTFNFSQTLSSEKYQNYEQKRIALIENLFYHNVDKFYIWSLTESTHYLRLDFKSALEFESIFDIGEFKVTTRFLCEFALWQRNSIDVRRLCKSMLVTPVSIAGQELKILPVKRQWNSTSSKPKSSYFRTFTLQLASDYNRLS